MCGRYNLRTSMEDLVDVFSALPAESLDQARAVPRFNIAPTQTVLAIREENKTRMLTGLHWGLIPFWAKDKSIGNRMINARGETVASKPSFRAAFKKRRCLVLADGFYEWKKLEAKNKQPYHIQLKNHETLALAGLWETWHPEGGDTVESCTIITTEPNSLMAELHDRMPVILAEDDFDSWLDPSNNDKDLLQELIRPYPADEMEAYPISTLVNSPRNDVPDCIAPLDDAGE